MRKNSSIALFLFSVLFLAGNWMSSLNFRMPKQQMDGDVMNKDSLGNSHMRILRNIKPEDVDDVISDPMFSDKETLASALTWTRKREGKILHQADLLRAEVEGLRERLEPRTISTEFRQREPRRFCTDTGSEMTLLNAPDANFEGHGQTQRLDGIEQKRSIQSKFKIWICIASTRFSGVVRIHKQFNCNEDVAFSADKSYTKWIRDHFGPDEFVLGLEGPELHSLTLDMVYRGNCTYDLPFQVSTPGVYHLNLVWNRENFVAAREGKAGWLAGHLDKPLGEHCFVNLSYSNQGTEKVEGLRRHHRVITPGRNLPVCDLRSINYSYVPGRWVFKGVNSSSIFHKGKTPLYHRKVGDSYLHTWIRLEDFTWLPTNCALPNISQEYAMQCLHSKRVLFEGDSHMRMLFNSVLTYVCGPQKEWSGWNSQCGGACSRKALSNVCMRKDGTGSAPSFMDTSAVLTFINFGQHFCDGERHKTYRDYALHLDRLVLKIKKLDMSSRRKIIWHETNMAPFRKDPWIRGYGDQRTNIKLAMYNMYATGEMRKLGVPIIPSFSQTLPLFAGSLDSAHIPNKFITESSLKFVLALACEN